jgi:4-hydroxybenzoate polyprenyltransferase/phosphoserine phosphatase
MTETLTAAHFASAGSAAVPLCVDLDGTLVRTDMLIEGMLRVAASRHCGTMLRPLLSGKKAALKRHIAELALCEAAILPYNEGFLAYLREQHANGRPLILVTAADHTIAHAVAAHLGIFDEVIASDGIRNLKGSVKAAALVERFGTGKFAYAGNDASDLLVWREAHSIVLVNAPRSVAERARDSGTVEAEFDDRPSRFRSAIKAMRPHQWLKNLLVFVPMIAAHAILEPVAWTGALLIFAAFCATASGIYIINDLSDLSADRLHPRKRNRPFANGALSVQFGVVLATLLLAAGISFAVAANAVPIIVAYAVTSVGYSLLFKEFPLVDVFILAALYTLRIVGGGVATGHEVSLWLFAFSGFTFLSLALIKRCAELIAISSTEDTKAAARRGYFTADLPILQALGAASAFASSVVLALFVGSDQALTRYAAPEALWAIVPLVLFWQSRLWLVTARGTMHDDPIVYAARDRVSWAVAAGLLVIVIGATFGAVSVG